MMQHAKLVCLWAVLIILTASGASRPLNMRQSTGVTGTPPPPAGLESIDTEGPPPPPTLLDEQRTEGNGPYDPSTTGGPCIAEEWAKMMASDSAVDDKFGRTLAVSGRTAVIGAWSDGDNGYWAGSAYVFRYDGANWREEAKLAPSDALEKQIFGYSVAIYSDTIIVGASHDSENGSRAGAVYVFQHDGAVWVQEAKLMASDGEPDDFFGGEVALFGDKLVIGATGDDDNGSSSGSAYVFRRDGVEWVEEAKLVASDGEPVEYFGAAVSVFEDAIVIGAPWNHDNGPISGSAYVFRHDGLEWVEEANLLPADGQPDDRFGNYTAIWGDAIVCGAYGDDDLGHQSGSAYVFRHNGSDWIEEGKLLASDGVEESRFGAGVTIFEDSVVAGASEAKGDGSYSGAAYVFQWNGDTWVEQAILIPSAGDNADCFGLPVTLDGDIAVIGASGDDDLGQGAGAAYVFSGSGSSWSEQAKLLASDSTVNDALGYSTAVWGDVAVIGAPGIDLSGTPSGSAYIIRRVGWEWIEQVKLLPSDAAPDDRFGRSVAISDNTAVIGAPYDDDNGEYSGSVYIFEFDGTAWTETAKLLPSDGDEYDGFGSAVAISADVLVIGAGTDDDLGPYAGSAYVFRFDGEHWLEEAKLLASDGAEEAYFGESISVCDDVVVIGAWGDGKYGSESGAAYVFRFNGEDWVEEAKLTASDGARDDQFGVSVSVSGNAVLIGAWRDDDDGEDSGSAYVFRFDGCTWVEETKLTPFYGLEWSGFGRSVALADDLAVIGAPFDDLDGAAYVFRHDGSEWAELARLVPEVGVYEDLFGHAVALHDGSAVIGAFGNDDSGKWSGAAYLYRGITDCNNNQALDICDIVEGTSYDVNWNGIPDECECWGDLTGDNKVGIDDVFAILGAWGVCYGCPEDLNFDGSVDIDDIFELFDYWGPCE